MDKHLILLSILKSENTGLNNEKQSSHISDFSTIKVRNDLTLNSLKHILQIAVFSANDFHGFIHRFTLLFSNKYYLS